MPQLAEDALGVALEVQQIATASACSVAHRAKALPEPLRRLVPFEASWLALLDPDSRTFVPLVIDGYDERIHRRLGGPDAVAEVELAGLDPTCPARRIRALPVPAHEVRSRADYLWPAGFREALGVGLFTADDRHVGVLGLNTDTIAHPTDEARDLIGLLASTIAAALDPARTVTVAARAVRGAPGGGVLTRAGSVLPLTGLPDHPLLSPGSTLLPVVAGLAEGGSQYASFLCPYLNRSVLALRRITVLGCADEPPHFLCAAIVVSDVGERRGLTVTQLELLGMLLAEWPDGRVAAALDVSERELTGYIDHAASRLGTPHRGVALIRAFTRGLDIPPGLGDPA
ncbi:GAF domain-containing protein [Pseudonocardia bannensis]|uniref:GAF domain-containing protein n=1 Tax=Pseudonocardia bannensis TaxID=630973 RepID=A0A848DJI2_9PSEU|nr:GAF domain-containing protein [Pseudonocardia bannensis]NMH92604.1 GAF domain-containing protein [Pseudonocardia bannensis]